MKRDLLTIVSFLLLLGCQKPVEKTVTQDSTIMAVSATRSTDLTLQNPPSTSTSTTKAPARPVDYPFSTWQQAPIVELSLNDTPAILALLGTPQRTDTKSLDYVGNLATKTGFTAESAPYLAVLDSSQYLELRWYFAKATNSDSEKQQSIVHANKAYNIARGLLGEEGGKLVQAILGGKVVQNQVINSKTVALAKCESFSCQIIIKK